MKLIQRRSRLKIYFILFFFFITSICSVLEFSGFQKANVFAQSVAINTAAAIPDASAMLDISSTTSGFLLPRMTSAERNTIPAPATGLIIYNTTTSYFNVYTPTGWYELVSTGCLGSVTGTVAPGKGVAINTIAAIADSAAICDVKSTVKGVLIPRTTTDSITTPATGLMIYDTTINALSYYNGTSWIHPCSQFTTATTGGITPLSGSLGVAINTSAAIPDPSAILDVSSRTKGLLIPRMTGANRDSLRAVTGLTVYNTNTNLLNYWSGTEWLELSSCSSVTGNSLRTNSADAAYLNRTPAGAGNRQTWTWSGWIKLTDLTTFGQGIFTGGASASDAGWSGIWVGASDLRVGGYNTNWRVTNAVFRDPAAWYHIVVTFDTPQAIANNRIRVYMNGVEITNFATINNPAQSTNYGINQATAHTIGYQSFAAGIAYFSGYMSDVNFIDGLALAPSSFGQINTTSGEWESKAYTGAYGTNGFHLDFADSSPASDLGKDISGNANNFTINNLDATDQILDIPANNFATFSPINNLSSWVAGATIGTLSNGNLQAIPTSSAFAASTIALPSSGKWYAEILYSSGSFAAFGLCNQLNYGGASGSNIWGFYANGGNGILLGNGGSLGAAGANSPNTVGDYMLIAVDAATNKIWLGRNRSGTIVWIGGGNPSLGTSPTYSGSGGGGVFATNVNLSTNTWYFEVEGGGTWTAIANFGQGGQSGLTYYPSAGGYFKSEPPCGFKALSTQNLSTPAIIKGSNYFAPLLYTGNGTSQSVSGLNFQPDFVWIKNRSVARSHQLFDAQRGVQKWLASNLTQAEVTSATYLTAFNSNGFSVGSDEGCNESGANMVSWSWKESITSGFDIVTYTGDGTGNKAIPHSLGKVPSFVIWKNRTNGSSNWYIYHQSISPSNGAALNLLNSLSSASPRYGSAAWSASNFYVGDDVSTNATNENGDNYVAYVFAETEGFSKFGSYTGNGSTDGPFVWTGFKPDFILIKNVNDGTTSWSIWDTERDTYNVANKRLSADASDTESTLAQFDILSNGFKIRANNSNNTSGQTIIYAAFAKVPFKYANAK